MHVMNMIQYSRRFLNAADEALKGIYEIGFSDDAVMKDLMEIIIQGSKGNDWPLVANDDGWRIYSNSGDLAEISGDLEELEYIDCDGEMKLSALGIAWVFAEILGSDPDDTAAYCEDLFPDW